jgi:hypothetical protein
MKHSNNQENVAPPLENIVTTENVSIVGAAAPKRVTLIAPKPVTFQQLHAAYVTLNRQEKEQLKQQFSTNIKRATKATAKKLSISNKKKQRSSNAMEGVGLLQILLEFKLRGIEPKGYSHDQDAKAGGIIKEIFGDFKEFFDAGHACNNFEKGTPAASTEALFEGEVSTETPFEGEIFET